MDDFTLQFDRPGFGASFILNPKVLATKIANEETIELNVRQLFRRLTGRKKTIHLSTITSQGSPNPKNQNIPSDVSEQPRSLFRSSNTFDSIIDKLERKYYHAAHIDDTEGNSTASDGTESQLHTPDMEQSEKKNKKRKLISDDYDYSDPFIDDAEEMQEYEGAIAAKRKKAQKKGYYVSSGDVEPAEFTEVVFKQNSEESKPTSEQPKKEGSKLPSSVINKDKKASENIPKQKSATTKAKSPKVQTSTQNTAIANSSSDERIVSNSITTLVPVPSAEVIVSGSITNMGEVDIREKLVVSIPLVTDVQLNSVALNETEQSATEPKKTRVSVPKPVWVPKEAAVLAMNLFKDEVEKFGPSSLKKSSPFPTALEQPLLDLHAEVMKFHDLKEISKSVGYYEFISSCLGSYFPAGRVKSNLSRLQSKENCRKIRTRVTVLEETLKNDLRNAIVPCPEDKKFPAKDAKTKEKKDAVVAPGEEMDVDGEPGTGSSQMDDPLMVSTRTEVTTDSISISQPTEEKKGYVWFCKFSLPLRQRLVELIDLVAEWVKAENEYRSKLVLADKKDMLPDEYVELDSAVEVEKLINSISTIFPDDCLEGDKNAIKKAIKTERSRLRRGVSATNSGTKSSNASIPVVAGTATPNSHAATVTTATEVPNYF